MAIYIEKGTNYAYTIERIKNIRFRSLRSVSVEFTKKLPYDLSEEAEYEGEKISAPITHNARPLLANLDEVLEWAVLKI